MVRSRRSSRCITATGLAERGAPICARATATGASGLRRRAIVVLFPDSFGSRGIGAQCNAGPAQHALRARARGRRRRGAALAAGAELRGGGPRLADRLGQWRRSRRSGRYGRAPRKKDDKPDFRSAIAFYPGCRRLRDTAWSARLPTLILIGAKDDWTPGERLRADGGGRARPHARAPTIQIYPDAYHDFDHPNLPLQQRTNVACVNGTPGRVHVGTDQAARADAMKRVAEWLAR